MSLSGLETNGSSSNHAIRSLVVSVAESLGSPSFKAVGSMRILIVEDDLPMCKFLQREFRDLLYEVDVCHNAVTAMEFLQSNVYAVILLDLSDDTLDSIGFLRTIRAAEQPHSPILMLTSRSATEDTILALDHGADDCLIKPFSFQEMQARMRSLLRRSHSPSTERPMTAGLVLRPDQNLVVRGQRRIELTPREFAILEHLVAHSGKTVSRADLMREVWKTADDPRTNIVDVYMKYLRDKIDTEGEPKLIRTIRGVGYILDGE